MIETFANNMHLWFSDKNYKGLDPYQLDEKASIYIRRFPFLKYLRKLAKPLHVFIPRSTFDNFKPIYHPKAIGLIIGGNNYLYLLNKNENIIQENNTLIQILLSLKSTNYKYLAWGHPFEWGSKPRYPKNTPAVCVISPIANCLLDFYYIKKEQTILAHCENIALHLIYENKYQEISSEEICFNYSPVDNNQVFNSNALAASFLIRLGRELNNQTYIDIAKKSIRFVVKKQEIDGSWKYSTNSDTIDNRHTGFILESIAVILKYWNDDTLLSSYNRGLDYYDKNLMQNNLPKWSPEKEFPIDIHDIAQAILTYVEIDNIDGAFKIADYAIKKMSNSKDEFYFKLFKNGKVNKNVFIRWGQAWMYYALCKMMFYNSEKS